MVGKCEPFESDVHLTFWARGPGIQAGRALETPTQHTDFAITFVEIAQAKIPSVRLCFADQVFFQSLISCCGLRRAMSWMVTRCFLRCSLGESRRPQRATSPSRSSSSHARAPIPTHRKPF